MQDLDFSIQNQSRLSAPALSSPSAKGNEAPKATGRHLSFSPFLYTALFSFSLGTIAGVFIAKAKDVEKNIVSQPDDLRPQYSPYAKKQNQKTKSSRQEKKTSFTNAPAVLPSEGRFLIKVGVYPSSQAADLTAHINSLSAFRSKKAVSCRKISRKGPLTQLAFRIPVPKIQGQENVIVGCFKRETTGVDFLANLTAAKIHGTQAASLYRIQD